MQQSKHQEYQMLLGNLAISNYWGEELVPLNVYGGYSPAIQKYILS